MDEYAKNEQRRLLWLKNEARRQEQRGPENFSVIEIVPKFSQNPVLHCSKIRTFTQGPGTRCIQPFPLTLFASVLKLSQMIFVMERTCPHREWFCLQNCVRNWSKIHPIWSIYLCQACTWYEWRAIFISCEAKPNLWGYLCTFLSPRLFLSFFQSQSHQKNFQG